MHGLATAVHILTACPAPAPLSPAPLLSLHLPLSPAQRAAQSWEPGKAHPALDRILERDAADAAGAAPRAGPLSW